MNSYADDEVTRTACCSPRFITGLTANQLKDRSFKVRWLLNTRSCLRSWSFRTGCISGSPTTYGQMLREGSPPAPTEARALPLVLRMYNFMYSMSTGLSELLGSRSRSPTPNPRTGHHHCDALHHARLEPPAAVARGCFLRDTGATRGIWFSFALLASCGLQYVEDASPSGGRHLYVRTFSRADGRGARARAGRDAGPG